MAKGSSISKTAMWILMGLLILGLGGFGAVNLSGNLRSIGTVGDKSIPVDAYARQLQNEIRAIEQQTGESLPFARAQEIGLDRAVLQRLVRNRALDHETSQLGLSIGDEALREDILDIPAFQGVDGTFDREAYRFALQQGGLSEADFETSLREEAARTLLQRAVTSGVVMPDTYAETLMTFIAQERSFTWSVLDSDDLAEPVAEPTEAQLQAYYAENQDAFMLPLTKKITYVWLSPEDMLDEVEVPEDELRRAYDDRAAEFQQPERRLVERLVFADQDAADRAAAALEVDGTTFNALVQERGLDLADIDMGDLSRLELDAAGEAVFGAEVGDVVGPLPSSLGPALFRVNGVLPAQNTSFDDARPALEAELAASRAARAVEARAQELDDRLAGGASLEQMAEETKLTLGTIDWTPESSEGIAAYTGFRDAAADVTASDFPRIEQLEDGGVFALRLDEQLEERPEPFEQARDDVRAAWEAQQTVEELSAQANDLAQSLGDDASFEEAGLDATVAQNQTRRAFIEGTPENFMETVFDMTPGDVSVLPGDGQVFIVRLDDIADPEADDETAALRGQLSEQLDQNLSQDLYAVFADDVVRRAGPQVDQRALQAVHVNFP
ncbi:Peptidyl-prolyl cis-trans isomerase D [Sulfitobacter sp. THAF37]|uniref:peptidyl-prolyl cis-trans isomerase n=1 Tax=Sulfitobacter sp. THAF37 TaxID=2587855 RepID=UPI0012685EE8|nr:peptidyl-prolyl cis-trans isomerase [Sulfitobacter sp. THAF37]QFT59701.1 Peptidyl-prolyl cis-trans isomerase D [Sulfitobacter sp. THAF37]